MMKRGMNMILKAVVLPLLATAFCSCALGETDVMSSLDEEPVANYQVMGTVSDEAARRSTASGSSLITDR